MSQTMQKILVIGCPGSGKSTFSRALHKKTLIPLFHLDMMRWQSDRTMVPRDVFMKRLDDVLAKSSWIIDGNYGSTMEYRMEKCDTVFFLDFDTEVCLAGIRERIGKPRLDMPWNETEEDPEFMDFIKNYNTYNRPKVLDLLSCTADKTVIIFKNRTEANQYLKNL